MRIDRLDLLAFGPFTDHVLEFRPRRVELIYGPNGAGKSSARRGLTALLYGIAMRTTDDHVHEKKTLRVGALLSDDNGSLEVIRRKTQKDSLLGLDGRALDERRFANLLGAVNENLFSTMFALDHDRLRAGGRELLKGTGDLAEQLFGAGLGRNIHEVLAGLHKDAEQLFTPRARSKELHKAINEFKETKRSLRSLVLRPDEWATAQQDLQEKTAARDECETKLCGLSTRKVTLERYQKVLPLLVTYDDLQQKRKALGDVVFLSPESAEVRRDTQRELIDSRNEINRLRPEIADVARELQGLTVPEDLLDRKSQVDEIEHLLGAHRKAALDLNGLKSKQRTFKDQARAALRNLGKEPDLNRAREFLLPVAPQVRIRTLVGRRQVLNERLRTLEAHLVTGMQRASKVHDELLKCKAPQDTSAVQAALDDARQHGDLPVRCAAAERNVTRRRGDAEATLRSLGLLSGTLEEADHLPLPLQEGVARFQKRWDTVAQSKETISHDLARLKQDLLDCDEEQDALRRKGEVPTVGELERLREHRNHGWALVRRTWLEGADTSSDAKEFDNELPLSDAYERAVRKVDTVADVLRQAADRVAKNEQLLSQQDRLKTKRRATLDQLRSQKEDDEEMRRDWQELWKPAGIDPLPPAEMRSWLERYAGLVKHLEVYREAEQQLVELRATEASTRTAMKTALDGLDEISSEQTLMGLRQRAECLVSASENHVRRRESLVDQERQCSESLDKTQNERDQVDCELAAWRTEWNEAADSLNLGQDPLPEEVEAVLERIGELQYNLDEMDALGRRMFGIKRDADEFSKRVGALAAECMPDLAKLEPGLAAQQLVQRFREGQVDRTRRDAIGKGLQEKRKTLTSLELREETARKTLDRLVTASHCESVEALEELERISERACRVDASIEEMRSRILEASAGATCDEVRTQTQDVDADALPGSITETHRQITEVQAERSALTEEIGGRKSQLERMDGRAAAAEAAAQGQEQLARVRELARQYAEFQLAAHLLEREIERYRKANEGPLLERTGELFKQLSLGRFERLRVDYDPAGSPRLVCVRDNEVEVSPHVLSDGEADQLYFALRIAGLERHLDSDQLLPFVGDDIFVNFDDERARVGFDILGEFAQHTQVIFFTHHPRLREIAREALPKELLGLHELPSDD